MHEKILQISSCCGNFVRSFLCFNESEKGVIKYTDILGRIGIWQRSQTYLTFEVKLKNK